MSHVIKLFLTCLVAQSAGAVYAGTTFTVAFFPNYVSMYGRSVTGHLFFSSLSSGVCDVMDEDGKTHTVHLNTSNAMTQFDLPGGKFYSLGEYVQKRGIFVNCSTSVSLYALSTRDQDNGAVTAFYVLSTSSLGTSSHYIVPSVPNNALIGVVAIQDNTTVHLDIKSNCQGAQTTKTLNFRDTYQIAAERSGQGVNCDFGGTRVTSDKPVAVFSGAPILLYPGQHGDETINQLPPVSAWGQDCIVPMIANMDRCSVRVVASQNKTNVTMWSASSSGPSDIKQITLNASQVHQEDFTPEHNVLITSTEPILVSQIAGSDAGYDAFTSLVPALTDYGTRYIVPDVHGSGRNFERHIAVMAETLCVPFIDVKANWTSFQADTHDISVALFKAESSLSEIKSSNENCRFAVQVTGFAQYEAYAYFATPMPS